MEVRCYELSGLRVAEFPGGGPQLQRDSQAIEIISEASACHPELIVLPVERLSADFFQLKTRVAGEILQKFVTYRKRVAILGDISAHLNESSSLRDFVYECNAGTAIWFVRTLGELAEKIRVQTGQPDGDAGQTGAI
ncbi:MAG: DUF4180 domain-containing protein [Acidobacteriaceae bacterium]|nr:DUF4180 domain-containing protein [Acidobacteriaceae bacterium]